MHRCETRWKEDGGATGRSRAGASTRTGTSPALHRRRRAVDGGGQPTSPLRGGGRRAAAARARGGAAHAGRWEPHAATWIAAAHERMAREARAVPGCTRDRARLHAYGASNLCTATRCATAGRGAPRAWRSTGGIGCTSAKRPRLAARSAPPGRGGRRRPRRVAKWRFNAWDSPTTTRATRGGAAVERPSPGFRASSRCGRTGERVVLEGGGSRTTGRILLVTEECMLSPGRSAPRGDTRRIRGRVREYLEWPAIGRRGMRGRRHARPRGRQRTLQDSRRSCWPTRRTRRRREHAVGGQHGRLERRAPSRRAARGDVLPARRGDERERLPASYANVYVAPAWWL